MTAKLADDFQHEFIQGSSGQVADGAFGRPAVLADLVAGVVEVLPPLAVFLPARLGCEAVAAHAAMDDPLEQGLMDVAFLAVLGVASRPCLATERVIGLLPQLGVDEGRMLAGVVLASVPDDPLVERIGDDGGDLVADIALAAHDGLTATTALHFTLGSAQALRVEYRRHLGGAAQLPAQIEDAPRHHGISLVDGDLLRDGIIGVAERCPSAIPQAAFGTFVEFVPHPLDGGFTLELCEGKQHVHHQDAHGRTGIEGLRGRYEMHAILFQHPPEFVEIGQGARDAVQLVGDHHVDLSRPDGCQQGLDRGTFEVLSGKSGIVEEVGGRPALVLVNRDCVPTDVALGIKRAVVTPRLVVGGNTGVDRAADDRGGAGAVRGGWNGMKWFHGLIEGRTSVGSLRQSDMPAVAVHGEVTPWTSLESGAWEP